MHKQFFQQNYDRLKSVTYIFISLFLIVFLSENIFAQAILTTNKFNKGIYKNYEEFLNNSPSVDYELIIKTRNENSIKNTGGGYYDVVGVYIQANQERVTSAPLIKNNFGYCDGNNIYVFDRYLHKKYSISASKILLISRFMIIQSYDPNVAVNDINSAVIMGGVLGGVIGAAITNAVVYSFNKVNSIKNDSLKYDINQIIKPDHTYVIDLNKNGKISKFWYQYLLELLYYEDEELYNEFQAIPKEKKQENVGTYFLKFIEKTK